MALSQEDLTRLETNIDAANTWTEGDENTDAQAANGLLIKSVSKINAEVQAYFAALGYEPPIAFQSGINVNRNTITIEESGNILAPLVSAIPFVTTGVFDPSRWYIITDFLPPQEANQNKVLTTNGDIASWSKSITLITFDSLIGLLGETTSPLINDLIGARGANESGDGGYGIWRHNGVTGQPASQSPAQLGVARFNDASGNQWELEPIGTPSVAQLGGLGLGDDTSAWQALLNSFDIVSGGEEFTVYQVTNLSLNDKQRVLGNFTWDFSGNPSFADTIASPLISANGTAGAAVSVSASISQNDTSIEIANTAGMSAGDTIEIATPGSSGTYFDSSVAVHAGELAQIKEVIDGNNLDLVEPVLEENGYSTIDAAQVRLIAPLDNIFIADGVTIKGKGRPQPSGNGDNGIIFRYCNNVTVHCNFLQVDLAAVRFEACYNFEASDCRIMMDQKGTNSAVNYGIVPSGSSKYGKIFNNELRNMRHGIVTSHMSSGLGLDLWGVSRLIDIYKNDIINTWHAGIATHNDVNRIIIRDNLLVGCDRGVNVREINADIINNNFVDCGQDISLTSTPQNLLISGNRSKGRSGGSFISTSFGNSKAINGITIKTNTVENVTNGRGVNFDTTGALSIGKIECSDNTFNNINTDSAIGSAIGFTGPVAIEDLSIKNNKVDSVTLGNGIYVTCDVGTLLIHGNESKNVANFAYRTGGTYTFAYGKANFAEDAGTNWGGNANLTNSASLTTDNTFF